MIKHDEFQAGGVSFRLTPMAVRDARKLYPHVLRVMQPVVAAIAEYQAMAGATGETGEAVAIGQDDLFGMIVKHLPNVSEASKEFEQLAKPFEDYCKVQLPEIKGDLWLPLGTFVDEAFRRKHGRQVEWLARCILIEFGDFLGELGLSL